MKQRLLRFAGHGRPAGRGRALLAGFVAVFAATTIMTWLTPAEAVPRAVKRACRSDYKRLCPRYRIGTSKMRSCMRASVGGMSARCYNKLIQYGYGGSRKKRSRRSRRRRR